MDIQTIQINDDDVFVLITNRTLTAEQAGIIRSELSSVAGFNKVVVLSDDIEMKILQKNKVGM